jgi:hypothetical protein
VTNPTPPSDELRASFDLPFWHSPGDKRSTMAGVVNGLDYDPSISLYDDVGTSYVSNFYWLNYFTGTNNTTANVVAQAERGKKLIGSGQVQGSRLVAFFDGTPIAVVGTAFNTPPKNFDGEFGGRNSSVMGFYDGHAAYLEVVRTFSPRASQAQRGLGSMVAPGFNYSFVIDGF